MTELNEDGTKKRTSVYVGSGILAEQLVRAADDTHSTAWEDVVFKHEDIVTGSYQMTKADGALAYMNEPPSSMELEPLGGDIPTGDPVVEDDGIDPRPLSSYQWGGDVGGVEHGCELDGMPFPCTLLRELMYGDESHYLIGVRYQGDEHGAWGLSTFVRDIYKDDEGPDKTPDKDGKIIVNSATRYQYSIYSLLFGFGDDIWASTAPDRKKLSATDLRLLRSAVIGYLTDGCKSYIKELLNATAKLYRSNWDHAGNDQKKDMQMPPGRIYDDFESLFDAVAGQGGFWGSVKANVSTMFSSPDSPKKDATVYLGKFISHDVYFATPGAPPSALKTAYNYFIQQQAITTIHELFHFSFSDVELARAIASRKQDGKRFSYADTMAASKYWNDDLKLHCGSLAGN